MEGHCRWLRGANLLRGLPSQGERECLSREGRIHVLESIARLQGANEWADAGNKLILTSIRMLC